MSRTGFGVPVVGFCGFSNSGKTTLIEALVPRLTELGLTVAVVKHDAHGVQIDREGKDSDRLFRAGANVLLRGSNESAARWHRGQGPDLHEAVHHLGRTHDLVLLEGHKQAPIPKLWLLGENDDAPPGDVTEIIDVLRFDHTRVAKALDMVVERVRDTWDGRPIRAGILVGGQSRRMGSPKQLVEVEGEALLDRVIAGLGPRFDRPVLLGAGRVPSSVAGLRRIPDPPGLVGPIAGFLAAMRWDPDATWLMAACDQPSISPAAVSWLLDQRQPGRWAIMPRLADGPLEPFLAIYEPQSLPLLEAVARKGFAAPWRIAEHQNVASPSPPDDLATSWRSVNTPEDLASWPD
jgi:glutamate dehydrogenase (NADP+)/cyclic pyranopterin phosphate synthase/molybdopterin-guanine dinucleotide biosynthesis protein A